MNLYQKISWLLTAGITESIEETPQNRLLERQTTSDSPVKKESSEKESAIANAAAAALQSANSCTSVQELRQRLTEFNECPLKKTAAHTMSGRGIEKKPLVMCIGDMPNAQDDRSGQIFSGEVGALLDRMLAAIGLSTDKNVYLSVLIPWRSPGNRAPTAAELAQCLPFLKKEIELVQPQTLLLFGNLVTESLLNISSVPKARGKIQTYTESQQAIPAVSTFPPIAVLNMPAHRKAVWEDLQLLKKNLPS